MGTPDGNGNKKISDLVDRVKLWIPRRSSSGGEASLVSRDFWMPDQSCRVCYECDSQFTVFNRRHHCRLCGRVFCAKCTANSIPTSPTGTACEDWDRIRVCNYCFKQWEQGLAAGSLPPPPPLAAVVVDSGTNSDGRGGSPGISRSPSSTSLASSGKSSSISSSNTVGSTPYSTGPYHRVPYTSAGIGSSSPRQSAQMDSIAGENENSGSAMGVEPSVNQFGYCINRSDDEDDDYGVYRTGSAETRDFSHRDDDYYGGAAVGIDEIDHMFGPQKVDHGGDQNQDAKGISSTPLSENSSPQDVDRIRDDECEAPSCDVGSGDAEPVDFENNGLLWVPPEPEDEEDEREAVLFEDDDEDEGATGEWGYLRPSNSFGSRDKSIEEHRKATKNVVDGHFRALVAQLLQVENLPVSDEGDKENWLNIITSLSWEAASLLKPDTSKSGGMDPGGYVKVKCIACGSRSESMVVKGVVCKKNVAHRRMMSKIDKPRFLILGGALEYQRVSNLLSSVDTLLQQEMDHLKMAVAKIDAHHPNVLLVEKSVSRYAQEYLLAKDISLVLNIKRPLLERMARCTGAQMVPSIDHLTSQKLGYCDMFHVEKFLEEHGSAGQGGKKLTKTLMFFEGCPKPLGCTILLKGANGDELKKVKHVVQYAVFAAYHLALETSFLADEGASLPELPLKSPITVALPDKPSSIERSIFTIPGFSIPGTGKHSGTQPTGEVQQSNKSTDGQQNYSKGIISDVGSSTNVDPICWSKVTSTTSLPGGQDISGACHNELSSNLVSGKDNKVDPAESLEGKYTNDAKKGSNNNLVSACTGTPLDLGQVVESSHADVNVLVASPHTVPGTSSLKQDGSIQNQEIGSSKEDFPPSASDHQSILVSLSTRCVWKGTVCERAHLFRIKYYGSFDKPLGRFLRDHLFDQNYRCRSCDMPSEAHVHCYTHRQGSLTISVKKRPEFLLPGEREGKIWMWHRCLRCPRINGFPPATRRVVMSDAAWGLSFGKFLELSFSNHAAASRVASCGHSLHRDCLRFYGFGRMVACFRYASIDVHSVYLPPPKMEFNYDNQECMQKEVVEVHHRAELLFNEVQSALHQLLEKISAAGLPDGDMKALEHLCVSELEGILQKEKEDIEGSLQKSLFGEAKVGQPSIDILEINKLRRQILFLAYVWDQRLIYVASLGSSNLQESLRSFSPGTKGKRVNSVEKLVEVDVTARPGKGYSSCDSFLMDVKPEVNLDRGGNDDNVQLSGRVCKGKDVDQEVSSCATSSEETDPLESGKVVRRARSEGEFPVLANLSETLDAAWTGESQPASMIYEENGDSVPDSSLIENVTNNSILGKACVESGDIDVVRSIGSALAAKAPHNSDNLTTIMGIPFPNFFSSFSGNLSLNPQKLGISEYNPVYISLFRELERQSAPRLLLPAGVNDTVIPVYDDEPTSIVAYTLVSSDYHLQMSELEKTKDFGDATLPLPLFDSVNLLSLNSFDDSVSDSYISFGSAEENVVSLSGSRGSQVLDPLTYTKDFHARVSFTDDGPQGKVKYAVTCYYAKRFEALRRICCPSELDFIRSLSRCKKWGAQGGKSNVFFAKTLDDRFIIKQVTKTELESFIKFGPAYFKYLSESISTGCPTCLAKILGIYQVTSKHLKGGRESKMDVLVMENLLYRRTVTRLYDLKGSSRSRYNPDTSGNNKVLLDQNLIEAMPTSPIFVGNKAKRLLERAVWNDTSFLASVDVMDYSLLVGVDEEKHELVLGIIDFMRQYTWDKHLETWVKTSGILGGSKNTTPTVISPEQYKKRFRKAMTAYFLMVPDQWSPPPKIVPSGSQSDLGEEKLQSGALVDR